MNAAQRLVGVQELIDARPQVGVVPAGLVQESRPLVDGTLEGSEENRSGLVFDCGHGNIPGASPLLTSATRPDEYSHDRRKNLPAATHYLSRSSSLRSHARA
jgi:hypothetical protein